MLRILLATALVLASAGAYAQFNKCGPGFCPGGWPAYGLPPSGGSIPAPTGRILMVDGVSLVLQTDGVSKICLAGGC